MLNNLPRIPEGSIPISEIPKWLQDLQEEQVSQGQIEQFAKHHYEEGIRNAIYRGLTLAQFCDEVVSDIKNDPEYKNIDLNEIKDTLEIIKIVWEKTLKSKTE
jgi:hypothetical protein